MKFLLCTAAALIVSTLAGGAQHSHRTLLDEATGSLVEVISVFSDVPPTGCAPIRVRVINNTGDQRTITLRTTSRADNSYGGDHQLESSFSLTAPANKTTEREFMVPVCADMGARYHRSASLTVAVMTGNRSDQFGLSAGGSESLPFTAFSKALAGKSLSDINNAASSSSSSRFSNAGFATLYDPAQLPSDWRGFSGLDTLAITADEWAALAPGVRTAIVQWVKLGGTLDLYLKSGAPSLDALGFKAGDAAVPARGGHAHPVGTGWVCGIEWSGSELDASHARNYSDAGVSSTRRIELGEAFRQFSSDDNTTRKSPSPNPLVSALGEKNFAAWQVGIILFIFGIVVGPLNLFYFARAGRRHRLFYTTPLISVAAAVILLIVIFFQDGTGGTGHRASLVYLDAAGNTAFIRQFQVSRTGVLFGGAFTTDQPAVVNMALLPDSRWTRLKPASGGYYYGRSRGDAQRYTVANDAYAGDWFQSRTEQAQIIDSVQSTRGRIELKAGSAAAPVVTSTFTVPLERLFYADADGNYWASSGPVPTGAEVALTKASREDYLAWRREAVSMLHGDLRQRLAGLDAKTFFYAASRDAGAGTVATLDSIDWESDSIFLCGPLAAP
jgi:hypothetical protein